MKVIYQITDIMLQDLKLIQQHILELIKIFIIIFPSSFQNFKMIKYPN